MESAELLTAAMRVIADFVPAVSTLDAHVAAALAGLKLAAPDADFVQQVAYGVVRHEASLRIVLNALYHTRSLVRADYPLYRVLAYLVLFRAGELGWHRLTGLLRAVDVAKAHSLLSFLFDADAMAEWVKEGLCRVLDRGYVEGTLLTMLERFRPAARRWLADHESAAFGAHASRQGARGDSAASGGSGTASAAVVRSTKPLTVPMPPALTAPKVRPLPEPVEIPASVTANPIPPDLDATTMDSLAETAAMRRQRARSATAAKYRPSDAFALHTTRSTVAAVRAELEAREAATLRFGGIRARPPPTLPPDGADVKLTRAALLREDVIFKRRQAEDAAEVRRFERERHDATEYHARIEAAEAAEETARLEAVRRRKAELSQSARRAAAATAAAVAIKAADVVAMKAEAAAIVAAREEERVEAVRLHRGVVAEVREVEHEAPVAAKRRLTAVNAAAAAAAKEAAKQRAAAKAAADAAEAVERQDVIRQIRALERVPRIRVVTHDPTTTPGHGFLDEMSLVELRERLAIARARTAEEVEAKRLALLRAKREATEITAAKAANLAELRATAALASREARTRRRVEEEDVAAQERETLAAAALEVASRIEAKHAAQEAERLRLAEERRRITLENQFFGHTKAMLEERRIASVFAGAERRAAAETMSKLAAHLEAQRLAAVKRSMAEFAEAQRTQAVHEAEEAKAAAVRTAASEAKRFAVAELAHKERRFLAATVEAATLRDLRDAADPYTASVRGREREQASATRRSRSVAAAAASRSDTVGSGGHSLLSPVELAATTTRTRLARLPASVDAGGDETTEALRHTMNVRLATAALG